MAFLDPTAALDTTNRNQVWQFLEEKVSTKLIKAIKDVYKVLKGWIWISRNERIYQLEQRLKTGRQLQLTIICT